MRLKIEKGSKHREIREALENTGNHCPCVPRYAWSNDTLCMCKEFREQETEGECHCGMFNKVWVEE